MAQMYSTDPYGLVAEAIGYLQTHHLEQPSLDTLAQALGRSPYQLQRTFQAWAGVSPKTFLRYLSLQHAKTLLQEGQTLLDTSLETGLSSPSRLHDLFVQLEAMTPGMYRRGAKGLDIRYQRLDSPFGPLLAAATPVGICRLVFTDHLQDALRELHAEFPGARFLETTLQEAPALRSAFVPGTSPSEPIRLHLKGSPFQRKVWEALLRIPSGHLESYSGLAQRIGQAGAARAIGSALAANPIAYLIPCHRVIQASGLFGQYHWDARRKAAILAWESAQRFGERDLEGKGMA